MYSILASNGQNIAPDPTVELTTLAQRPPSREGHFAFGNRSFAPSALNPSLAPKTKILTQLAPKHKILEPPLISCFAP